MKHPLHKIFKKEISISIIIFFISTILALIFQSGRFTGEGVLLIILSTVIAPFISLSIEVFKARLLSLENSPTLIQSKIIREVAQTFADESLNAISNTLSAVSGGTNSILWELTNIGLGNFEKECMNCEPEKNPHNCTTIIDKIKRKRRNRITKIANDLILNDGDFYATETELPSKIISTDTGYYVQQKKILKDKNINIANRLIILKKDDLKKELEDNKKKLKEYIDLHINSIDTEKSISLKIVAYTNDISEVFASHDIDNELYDFVISEKIFRKHKLNKKKDSTRYQITVFAQSKQNVLFSFDSKTAEATVQKFKCAFDTLYSYPETFTDNICYSGEIKSFDNVKTFIKSI